MTALATLAGTACYSLGLTCGRPFAVALALAGMLTVPVALFR